jgi:hypothetical protein
MLLQDAYYNAPVGLAVWQFLDMVLAPSQLDPLVRLS